MTHAPLARWRAFARLCLALVANFPRLLCRPPPGDALTSYDRMVHEHREWKISEGQPVLQYYELGDHRGRHTVETMDECDRAASSHLNSRRVQLHPHPHLTGLDFLEWRDTRRVVGTNAYVAQTLFRMKANKFPLWNRAADNLSCPFQHCSDTTPVTTKHIFWECPAAQRWWSALAAVWTHPGLGLGDDALTWIFGPELPDTPRQA